MILMLSAGVARHQGKALFVSGALPGEQVEVMLLEDKRQYARGRAQRILQPSPERVTPRCPWFNVCGGCQQQHASQSLQQQSKAKALAHLLTRETGRGSRWMRLLATALTAIVDALVWGCSINLKRRRCRWAFVKPPRMTGFDRLLPHFEA